MRFNAGQLVIVVPNVYREDGYVGRVEKLEENITSICGRDVYTVKHINDGTKHNYYEEDLRKAGDELADDIIDEIFEDGTYYVTDMGQKWMLSVDDLYYCKDCYEIHNSLYSAKFYEPTEPTDTEEKEADMFMVGYLECLKDLIEYQDALTNFNGVEVKDTSVKKALNKMNKSRYVYLKDSDFAVYYSTIMKIKEETKNKPKLTLADIKEKLGYDFDLVD